MNKKQGIIKLIILIVIGILILSYFRIDIRRIVESDMAQKNLGYVWGIIQYCWHTFLERPALWIWNQIVIDLIISKLTPMQ